jgi:hypothetical protein
MRTANLVMSALFLFSTVLQMNDPDPVRWMAIYGAAAAVCLWLGAVAPRGNLARAVPLAVALVALAWSAAIAARAAAHVSPLRLFESWEMKDTAVEEDREMYGLLVVGAWMLIAAARPRARSSRSVRARRP